MYLIVILLCSCLYFSSSYCVDTIPEIKINVIKNNRKLMCENAEAKVLVNKPFDVFLNYTGFLYRTKCSIGDDSFDQFWKESSRPGYKSENPLKVTKTGAFYLECKFHKMPCRDNNAFKCYYTENKYQYEDPEVKCTVKIQVVPPDQIILIPTGRLTANQKSFNNTGTNNYDFYDGEPINFSCHKNTGSFVELSYKTGTKNHSTELRITPSVEMYLKLTKANDGSSLFCLVTDEKQIHKYIIELKLTHKITEAIIGFAVNGLILPVIKRRDTDNKLILEYEYRFHQKESIAIGVVNGEHYTGICNVDTNAESKNEIYHIKGNKEFFITTLNTQSEIGLSCTVVDQPHTFHVRIKLIYRTVDYQPFIDGLSMANILLKYTDNKTTRIEYDYIGDEKLDLTCSDKDGAKLKNIFPDASFKIDAVSKAIQLKPGVKKATMECSSKSTTVVEFIRTNRETNTILPIQTTTAIQLEKSTTPTIPPIPVKHAIPVIPTIPVTHEIPVTPTITVTHEIPVTPTITVTHAIPVTPTITVTPAIPVTTITAKPPEVSSTKSVSEPDNTAKTSRGTGSVPARDPDMNESSEAGQSSDTNNPTTPAHETAPEQKQKRTSSIVIGTCVVAAIIAAAVICTIIHLNRKKRKSPHPHSSDVNYQILLAHKEGLMPTPAPCEGHHENGGTNAVDVRNTENMYANTIPKGHRNLPTEAMYSNVQNALISESPAYATVQKKNDEPTYASVQKSSESPAYATVHKKDEPTYASVQKSSESPAYATVQKNGEPTYAFVQKSSESPAYADVQKNGEPNYASVQKSSESPAYATVQKKDEPTYASVQKSSESPGYATVQKNGEPNYASVQKSCNEPTYAEVEKTSKYQNLEKILDIHDKLVYAELVSKSSGSKNNLQGQKYANMQELKDGPNYANFQILKGDEKYVNMKTHEYAEPTYSEVSVMKK